LRLLEITGGDYWRLLEINGDHWRLPLNLRLLEITTGDYWGLLEITLEITGDLCR